jgi:glycerophosphoryl diester phosphodiesterase
LDTQALLLSARLAGLTTLLLVGLGAAVAWRVPRIRHEVCFELAKWERAVDGSPRGPSGGPPARVEATPHLLHAGKPGPGYLPNSERSLREAARTARAVEIDVGFTRDLVPYLSHENDFGALLGTGPDRLSAHTSAEVDAMAFTDGSRPMPLAAFAAALLGRFDLVAIDLKTTQADAEAKARTLAAILAPFPAERLQVIGRPGPILIWLERLRPALATGCESYLPLANRAAGLDLFSARATEVTRDADRRAREGGLVRLYWTATSADELARIQAWRPDAIIVDLADAGAEALPAAWRRSAGP